jgi:hypothetical protein
MSTQQGRRRRRRFSHTREQGQCWLENLAIGMVHQEVDTNGKKEE